MKSGSTFSARWLKENDATNHSLALRVSNLLSQLLRLGEPSVADATPHDAATIAIDAAPFACEASAVKSKCGNQASIIQGRVTIPQGLQKPNGTLVAALLHKRHGNPAVGGHPHWMWRLEDSDLGGGSATFAIDMCDGNAVMWSEENCEYNLVLMVDYNNNNGISGGRQWVPDANEPTVLHTFDLSCHSEGPTCLDLQLECTDGEACLQIESPESCECASNSCESPSAICRL